jgi:hypothetical protein
VDFYHSSCYEGGKDLGAYIVGDHSRHVGPLSLIEQALATGTYIRYTKAELLFNRS